VKGEKVEGQKMVPVTATLNGNKEVIYLDDKSGYCYDMYSMQTQCGTTKQSSTVSNINSQTQTQTPDICIILPNNFDSTIITHYINFLTRTVTDTSGIWLTPDHFSFCQMLCDDSYFRYLLQLVYRSLERQSSPNHDVNDIHNHTISDQNRQMLNIITSWYMSLQQLIWLHCPYQLLPRNMIDDIQFMDKWRKYDGNKKVTIGDNMYVYRHYEKDSAQIYKRNIYNYNFVGLVMILTWYPNSQIKSKSYHDYSGHMKKLAGYSLLWEFNGDICQLTTYNITQTLDKFRVNKKGEIDDKLINAYYYYYV
jgi:hypothetical protein